MAPRCFLPDWIESAGRRSFTFNSETNRYGATGYGYSWWIDPDNSMVAVGFAGQSLYVNRKAGARDRHAVMPAATALFEQPTASI